MGSCSELACFSLEKIAVRPGPEEAGGFTCLASSLGESDLADTISPRQLGKDLVLCGEVKSSLGSGEHSQVSQHTELLVFSADYKRETNVHKRQLQLHTHSWILSPHTGCAAV